VWDLICETRGIRAGGGGRGSNYVVSLGRRGKVEILSSVLGCCSSFTRTFIKEGGAKGLGGRGLPSLVVNKFEFLSASLVEAPPIMRAMT